MALTTTPYLDAFDTGISSALTQIGEWSVVDGKAVTGVNAVAEDYKYLLLFDTGQTEMHSQVDCNFGDNYGHCRIIIRAVDENNYYAAEAWSTGVLKLIKVDNGSESQISSQNGNIPANEEFYVGIRGVGDKVIVKAFGIETDPHTITDAKFLTATKAGVHVTRSNVAIDNLRIAESDGSTTILAGGVDFPAGSGPTTSTLAIQTTNNLPASGNHQYYVHKVSDKSKYQEGLATFTNGAATIALPIADFPVSEAVDWQVIDPTGELEAGARQDTE